MSLHDAFRRRSPVADPNEDLPGLLLVDDEQAILDSLTEQARTRFRVFTATRPEQALKILGEREFAVIMSDQRMPGMKGHEFLERASEIQPEAVRLLLTGYSDIEAVVKAVNEGRIFYYLGKPWVADELGAILAKALEHNQLLQERRHLIKELRRANQDLEARVQERTRELDVRNRELEEKNRCIEALARTDPLTGLANRRVWDETLTRELSRSERTGSALTLMMLDLDHFKGVNDNYGHPVGDAVLVAVGSILQEDVRGYDLAVRYGGEEFAILFPNTPHKDAMEVAERLRIRVEALKVRGCPRDLSVSIGVACYRTCETVSELLTRVDAALYSAKAGGRNRVVSAESS